MKSLLPRVLLLLCACTLGVLTSFAQRPPTTAVVGYSPGLTKVEGNQPLTTSVVISITSPSNLPAGTPRNITPSLIVLSAPEGVTNEQALSFVSLSPTTLSYTGPNQTIALTVLCVFPAGVAAGDYAYKINTPGWGVSVQDQGAFLNATIYPQPTPGNPPVVDITSPLDGATFTYQPLVGPLTIPVEFTSTAELDTPITAIDADLSGVELAITSVDNGDGSFTSTGSVSITAPGIYSVNARASNSEGTAMDDASFTVVVDAPPPTAAISLPTLGSIYTLPNGGGTVSVPYAFSGLSYYGGITSLSATLNGTPVNFTPAGLGSLNATGTGSFTLGTSGTYELVVTAADTNGTATARTSFTVNPPIAVPAPTVSISQPLNGATFSRVAGSAPTQVSFSYTGTVGNGFAITSLTGTLNGSAVTATVGGLGTGSATGTGTLSISSPGSYTLTATAASGGVSATTSITFTVTETTPPPPPPTAGCGVNWLPPISLGNVHKGGSTVAVKFELYCHDCGSGQGGGNDDDDCRDRDHDDDDRDCDRDRDDRYNDDRDCDKEGSSKYGSSSSKSSKYSSSSSNSKSSKSSNSNSKSSKYGSSSSKDSKYSSSSSHASCSRCDYGEDRDGDGDPDHFPGQRTKSKHIIDKNVIVAISEVFANGNTSAPALFTYSTTMTSSTYTIQGNDMYHLNFVPARGTHRYRIEVFQFPNGGSTPVVIGTREFLTK